MNAAAGKRLRDIVRTQMLIAGFCQHTAIIGGHAQVTTFVELFRRKSGPLSIDAATIDRAAEHEHHVGMAVIGSAGAVLLHGSAKF